MNEDDEYEKHGISTAAIITAWDYWEKSKEVFAYDEFKRFMYVLSEFMAMGVFDKYEVSEDEKQFLTFNYLASLLAYKEGKRDDIDRLLKSSGMLDPENCK